MVTRFAAGQEKHAGPLAYAQKLALVMQSVAAAVTCEDSAEVPYERNVLPRHHIRGNFARLVKNSV
jgi:hypothetical protein